jgi:cellulose synthase/poly-beta-1,6-N-acetylglucosamine synthase-like glycosyltransferase
MKVPTVTVLVTVKNSKNTIQKCIKSILALNYPYFKVYITDAYSDDGTFEILKKLNKRYPQKIRLEQIRGNIAVAHNYMIKKTNTKFIAMTDADCVVDNNWLKNLISGFKSKDIIATTGFCSTPKLVNRLQKLIGIELEDRFRHAPKFVPRGPTMNLCVKSNYAKKIKFDERFDVAQETDWGYRLIKFGKMHYVSNAIVYHYHRPTIKSFLKQNFRYGRTMPLLYLKHKKKSTGDHLSKPIMILQEFILSFLFLFVLISIFYNPLINVVLFFIILLFIIYFIDIFRFTKNPINIGLLIILYILRNLAWTIGMFFGIFDLIIKKR